MAHQYPFTILLHTGAAAGLALCVVTLGACSSGDSDDPPSNTGGFTGGAGNPNGSGGSNSSSFSPLTPDRDSDDGIDVCEPNHQSRFAKRVGRIRTASRGVSK